MYMHQFRMLHVHTSNRVDGLFQIFRGIVPPTTLVYVSAAMPGAAERLINRGLGPAAWDQYRSPERIFPLRHRNSYYSLSHTASITAMAVATAPVGIDVEGRLSNQVTVDLAWALSAEELSELTVGDENRLTEIWTAKEASGKALGVGLGAAPSRILTLPAPNAPGYRISNVPQPDSGTAQVLTYGWWHQDHHIRIAWSVPAILEGHRHDQGQFWRRQITSRYPLAL
jgi:4'-phosphopantetheinyl transferase